MSMTDTELFAHVTGLDDARTAAILAGDFDRLESFLGNGLRYIHSSGADEDRATYLARLRDGYYQYRGLVSLARDFRRYGDVVLVNGDVEIDVIARRTVHKHFRSRYLQVWALEAEGWKMVSWQSVALPD